MTFIETDRLILRNVAVKDIDTMYDYRNNETVSYTHLLGELEGLVCPVMDARREQVYNALFRASGGTLTRLREDRAIALADLKEDLQHWAEPVVLVGDGALLCSRTIGAERLRLAPEHRRHQRAAGVALAAWASICRGEAGDGATLQPHYLRLSQAERERLARLQHTDRKDNE